jgi:cytochrome c-type biogenesis protein CcmH/NrfG
MSLKQLAALAALALVSTPSFAQELSTYQAPGIMFYYSIPLEVRKAKDFTPNYGMRIQGNRPYETVNIDKRLFNNFLPVVAGLEAKWIIAGVVAAGAAVAVSHKDKGTQQQYQQQQQAQHEQNLTNPNCNQTCP